MMAAIAATTAHLLGLPIVASYLGRPVFRGTFAGVDRSDT